MHLSPRRLTMPIALLATALVAAGCGGSTGKEIGDVKSCLDKLDLTVEDLPKDDAVTSGVFATSPIPNAASQIEPAVDEGDDEAGDDADATEFTFALAALVKTDDAVEQFEKDSAEFVQASSADEKLDIENGVDERYVWVVGGAKDSESFQDARDCIKP